ncbi:kinase-like protein [Tilletiaria anomala UBC 951]|uniref:Kinase-like protein n=1 Tax=Tilletiaria anomala (strain ATCC 24038 / CBS 436.72 / UBC 951) TaxID=1037660 RepID=A0A066W658_TILAU|nr:kinase-like protein [Tilletiaria anomala UBC 951]KDN49226.1 kinase-like protein [Tilletiaria anomala UBC 951]
MVADTAAGRHAAKPAGSSSPLDRWAPRKLSVVPHSPELEAQRDDATTSISSTASAPVPTSQQPHSSTGNRFTRRLFSPDPSSTSEASPSPAPTPAPAAPLPPRAVADDIFTPGSGFGRPSRRDDIDGLPLLSGTAPSLFRAGLLDVTAPPASVWPLQSDAQCAHSDVVAAGPGPGAGGSKLGSEFASASQTVTATGTGSSMSANRPSLSLLTFAPPPRGACAGAGAQLPGTSAPASSTTPGETDAALSVFASTANARVTSSGSGSRNDIFSAPSPVVLPAPRMGPLFSPRAASAGAAAAAASPVPPQLPQLPWAASASSTSASASAEHHREHHQQRLRSSSSTSTNGFLNGTHARSSSSGGSDLRAGAPSHSSLVPSSSSSSLYCYTGTDNGNGAAETLPPLHSPSPFAATDEAPAMRSKRSNSSFYDASAAVAPPPRRGAVPPSPGFAGDSGGDSGGGAPAMLGHARKPSTGRRTNEQRAQERARIRKRNNESVEFRLRPTKEYFLGEGRHCTVYLGAYRRRRTADAATGDGSSSGMGDGSSSGMGDGSSSGMGMSMGNGSARAGPSRSFSLEVDRSAAAAQGGAGGREGAGGGVESPSSPISNESLALSHLTSESGWKLCAIKRLHADKTAQLVGLDEAFALRRLGSHPGIVRLIDIKDEVETASAPIASAGAAAAPVATRAGAERASGAMSTDTSASGTPQRSNTGCEKPDRPADPTPSDTPAMRKKASMGLLGVGVPSTFATPTKGGGGSSSSAGLVAPMVHGQASSDVSIPSQLASDPALVGKACKSPSPPPHTKESSLSHRRLASQPFEIKGETVSHDNVRSASEMPSWSSQPNALADLAAASPALTGVAETSSTVAEGATAGAQAEAGGGPSPASAAFAAESSVASRAAGGGAARPTTHDTPRLLILLELMPHSLYSFARKHPEYIDVEQWLQWARQLADVLTWMHEKGAVHADVKKENILLTEDLTLKLCDFNSTLWIDPNAPPTDGAGLGTPAYGAPELTRAISGGMPFGYEVDVWSMGAVLYSLASGVEPFARANSMVDILHRKRIFFESEEAERVRRMNVAEGYNSGAGSACASRKSSLRERRSGTHGSSYHRRDGSMDSIDSVASNLTNMSTRAPSALAIASLLGDDEGFIKTDHHMKSDPLGSDPHSPLARAASIHTTLTAHPSASVSARGASSTSHLPLPFSKSLRRTASFQASQEQALASSPPARMSAEEVNSNSSTAAAGPPSRPYNKIAGRERSSGSVSSANSAAASQLYVSVAAALERAAKRKSSHHDEAHSPGHGLFGETTELTKAEQADLNRHYTDGAPAMILPGGGRLPGAARDLLARMLQTDPRLRPSAKEVKATLERIP